MIHLGHMVLFAAIVSVFFAFLIAPAGKRLRYGLKIFGLMTGIGLLVSVAMAPLS